MRKSIVSAAAVGLLLAGAGIGTASAAVSTDLASYNKFDGNLAQSVGSGPTASGVGSPIFVTGMFGSAVSLDNGTVKDAAATQWVDLGAFDVSATRTALTVSAWVNFANAPNVNDFKAIVGNTDISDSGDGTSRSFRLSSGSSIGSNLQWDITSSPTTFNSPSGSTAQDGVATVGVWKLVTATFIGGAGNSTNAGSATIYADGILGGTVPLDFVAYVDNSVKLLIGAEPTTATTARRGVTGLIDDVGIWSRALSAQEVAIINGLGRFVGLVLDSGGIDAVLAAYNATGSASSGVRTWSYKTGLTGPVGTTGGSIAGGDAYIVLGAGNGVQIVIPEPASLALLSISGLLLLPRRRKA